MYVCKKLKKEKIKPGRPELKLKFSGSTDDSVSFPKQSKLHLYRYIPGSLAPCQKLAEILSDKLR